MRFKAFIYTLTFLFGLFALFKAPNDPDFGWHYKYGEFIVQHGRILRENTFSYTFTDYKWANSYWVSQALMFLTHSRFGHVWAGLLFSFALSLTVVWYVRTLSKRLDSGLIMTTLVAILLIIELSGNAVTVRPMYFSCLFLMLLTVLLLEINVGINGGRLWILPILFLIWANAHADFTLGLFVLGLYVMDHSGVAGFFGGLVHGARFSRKRSLEPALNSQLQHQLAPLHPAETTCEQNSGRGSEVPSKILPQTLVVFILSVVVTIINPYGLQLWQTLIKESHPYQFKHIVEWVPVSTENIVQFVVYCAFLGLLVSALVGARQKLPVWYMLAAGVFCILALRSQYFLRVAVILGIYALLVFWTPYAEDIVRALSPQVVKKIRVGFMAFMLLTTLMIFAVFLDEAKQSTNKDYWLEKQAYPGKALDWAFANSITGNIFNYYGWGGYMIWQYPQIKTFVDGRMPSWREDGKSVFEDYISVVDDPAKNYHVLDDYNVSWILYPTETVKGKFLDFLSAGSGWRQVYRDDVSAIFVRN